MQLTFHTLSLSDTFAVPNAASSPNLISFIFFLVSQRSRFDKRGYFVVSHITIYSKLKTTVQPKLTTQECPCYCFTRLWGSITHQQEDLDLKIVLMFVHDAPPIPDVLSRSTIPSDWDCIAVVLVFFTPYLILLMLLSFKFKMLLSSV